MSDPVLDTPYSVLPNLKSQRLEPLNQHPSQVELPDYGKARNAKTEWTQDSYQGYFISLNVGENPSLRPSKVNPVRHMNGLIVDLDDCSGDLSAMMDEINNRIDPRFWPSWIARSASSHGFHLMYEWPSAQPVPSPQIFERFVAAFVSQSKLSSLPGQVDMKGTATSSQYFEIGREWTPLRVIPTAMTTIIAVRQVAHRMIKSCLEFGSGLPVSIKRVVATLSAKYPEEVDWSEFRVGFRCHRFWDPAADNESAAVVYENGIYAWTTGEYLPWSSPFLMGQEASEDAEDEYLANAIEDIWFDGTHYWHNIASGWVPEQADATKRKLKVRGLAGSCRQGESISQVDRALDLLHELRLEGVGPMLYKPQGLVTGVGGGSFLNTSKVMARKLVPYDTPREWGDGFPIIAEYLDNVWIRADKMRMLYWLKHSWQCGAYHRPHRGLGVIMMGPKGVGKNWFALGVIAQILGGVDDPWTWMTGMDPLYNGNYVGAPLWYISDIPKIHKDRNQHKTFGSNLKKVLADDTIQVRRMFSAPYSMTWHGRVVIACNLDPESLASLPSAGSLYDKMMVFELNDYQLNYYPSDSEIANSELDPFVQYLDALVIPQQYIHQRYGLTPYVSNRAEDLIDCDDYADHREQTCRRLIVEYVLKTKKNTFRPTDLLENMEILSDGFAQTVRNYYPNSVHLGRMMTMLERSTAGLITTRKAGGKVYRISPALLLSWRKLIESLDESSKDPTD